MLFINMLDVNHSVYWRSWWFCISVILYSFSWPETVNWQKYRLLNGSTAYRVFEWVLWSRSTFLKILLLRSLRSYWRLSFLVCWRHSLWNSSLLSLMLWRRSLNLFIHLVNVSPSQLTSMVDFALLWLWWLLNSRKFILPQTI